MRNTFARVFYLLLVSPLIPIAILYWVLERLSNSKTLTAWESWASKLAKKVTGA